MGSTPTYAGSGRGDLDALPDELVIRVLGYLSPKKLAEVSTVSKEMYSLAEDDQIWLEIAARAGTPLEKKGSNLSAKTLVKEKASEFDIYGRTFGMPNFLNPRSDEDIKNPQPDPQGRTPGQKNFGSILTDEAIEEKQKELDIHGRAWGQKNFGSILSDEEEAHKKKAEDKSAALQKMQSEM